MIEKFFTDEELVAYLDGEKELTPFEDIRQAIIYDAALQKRLDALTVDRKLVAESFAHFQEKKRDFDLPSPTHASPTPLRKIAAVAAIALLLGSGIGYNLASSKRDAPSGWMDYVAAYQALYINATLSNVTQTELEKAPQLTRVTSAIGKNITLDQLTKINEVDYKRAQILGFEGKPLVQLAFLSRTGEPIALCIFRHEVGKRDVELKKLENMQAASWSKEGYGYLLIGGNDERLIREMADHFVSENL